MMMVGPERSEPSDDRSLREGFAPCSQKRVPVRRNLTASSSIEALTMTAVPSWLSLISVT